MKIKIGVFVSVHTRVCIRIRVCVLGEEYTKQKKTRTRKEKHTRGPRTTDYYLGTNPALKNNFYRRPYHDEMSVRFGRESGAVGSTGSQ